MKIKKSLAFIAALSMLSVTGVNAFAEEAAVTEIESSAVEMTTETATDMEEEVVTETEATEEVAVDGIVEKTTFSEEKSLTDKNAEIITFGTATGLADSKDFTCDGYNFVAELRVNPGGIVVDKFITIYKYEEDGSKRETNINGKMVCTFRNGENPGLEENASLDYILSINGDSITINSTFFPWEYDEAQYESVNYVYDKATNSFVESSTITTTTTTNTTTAIDADFTIGNESFYTEVNGNYIVIYKITDKDSATKVGEFSAWESNEFWDSLSYKVYGNELVVIAHFGDDEQVAQSLLYDSSTGTFKVYFEKEYDTKKENFSLSGVSFTAVLTYGELEKFEDRYVTPAYLTIYYSDGTITNIKDVLVSKDISNGGAFATAYAENVNNFFKVSDDKLIIQYRKMSGVDSVDSTYVYDKTTNSFIEPCMTTTTTTTKVTTTNSNTTTTTTTKATIATNTSDTTGETSGSTTNGTANSPITADKMVIPAIAGSAALVLGAVIYVSKKRK